MPLVHSSTICTCTSPECLSFDGIITQQYLHLTVASTSVAVKYNINSMRKACADIDHV